MGKKFICETKLAGFFYVPEENKRLLYCGRELRVKLVREPDNKHDCRAVRVDYIDEETNKAFKLGYVPQSVNFFISSMVDAGSSLLKATAYFSTEQQIEFSTYGYNGTVARRAHNIEDDGIAMIRFYDSEDEVGESAVEVNRFTWLSGNIDYIEPDGRAFRGGCLFLVGKDKFALYGGICKPNDNGIDSPFKINSFDEEESRTPFKTIKSMDINFQLLRVYVYKAYGLSNVEVENEDLANFGETKMKIEKAKKAETTVIEMLQKLEGNHSGSYSSTMR